MNCPYCDAPLMGGMTSCPKCKFDINTPDGGPRHKEWLQNNPDIVKRIKADIVQRDTNKEIEKTIPTLLLTTCPSLEGYSIIEQYGLVFGEVAYKSGFLKSLGAGLNNLIDVFTFGDQELSGTSEILESARKYAIDKMKISAAKLGANAIIGIESESSFGGDIMHITIYGTAVKVVKN